MEIQRRYGCLADLVITPRSVRTGVAAVLLLSLATGGGCGAGGRGQTAAKSSLAAPSASESDEGMVTITDAWVKTATAGTTPIFGTIVNGTSGDLTVVSAVTEIARTVELVELVDRKTLRPKPGGFIVPAHGSHDLRPEGDRLVLVDLTQPLAVGDMVTVILHFADRSTLQFRASAKEGNPELDSYQPR